MRDIDGSVIDCMECWIQWIDADENTSQLPAVSSTHYAAINIRMMILLVSLDEHSSYKSKETAFINVTGMHICS